LTENHLQGKLTGSVSKENRSAYLQLCFEKFWVTGNHNSIEMEHILARAGRNYKFSSDKLSFDRNKTEVSSQENGYSFEHNLISSGAYGRDEMSVNKFMQTLGITDILWYRTRQRIPKNCGTAVGLD
jgi:hypothetical protein